jgi:THAP4-like, heme-binding beta-barrel domain
VSETFDIHPDIASISYLIGTWTGTGQGEYPTIEPFSYTETVTFSHVGKPYLSYTQETRHADDGRLLHAEVGYWRMRTSEFLELVIAHPTGVAEVLEGTYDRDGERGGAAVLKSTTVGRTVSSKEIKLTERTFTMDRTVDQPTMIYTVGMRAVGVPMRPHLTASLTKQP